LLLAVAVVGLIVTLIIGLEQLAVQVGEDQDTQLDTWLEILLVQDLKEMRAVLVERMVAAAAVELEP
jgi:hypothetical protein